MQLKIRDKRNVPASMSMYDLSGREVYQININMAVDPTIDISRLPQGLYQVVLTVSDRKVFTEKVLKN